MAAYRALQPRMAALGATCIYLSKPPAWFTKAVKAAAGTPVLVNVKGLDPDVTPVLVTLAELERLHQAAGLGGDATVDATVDADVVAAGASKTE